MKIALVILALAVPAVALGARGATVRSASNRELGPLVVSSAGMTVYHLTTEQRGHIACTGSCATNWPPLLVPAGAKPKAGAGIAQAKLGVLKRPDGRRQVTYAGMALYRFAGDTKAGATAGEGVGGVWFALHPSGALAKPAQQPATTTTATTTTSSGGGGGGYNYP